MDGLAVLADGIGGAAQVLAGVGELDVLQREGGEPGVAEHHNVPVQTLGEGREKEEEEEEEEKIDIWFSLVAHEDPGVGDDCRFASY